MIFARSLRDGATARIGAALGLSSLLLIAGCAKRTAADYLAAGDKALHENQIAEAEKDYQTAAQTEPANPDVHVALGKFYTATRNPAPAQSELLKAIALAPNNPVPHVELARLYTDQSRFGQAEEQWRAANALEPGNPAYRAGLAAALERNSKWDQAEPQLRTAVGLAPANAKLKVALGALLAEQHRDEEAQAVYAEARALDPNIAIPGAPAAPSAPAAAATSAVSGKAPAAAAPPANAKVAARPVVKPLNRKFLLSHNSPVYADPDASSAPVAQVHRGKWVHVTGISGNWLQIRMRNGTVGFIPAAAAE